ncbi:MAG: oligosaccharide flippase family protein [Candidatus Heimdallarchaeota archaeon]|nr:oligosaccharide flippase family protein [Candidatus Heimdallarchaeota archaeon]
MKLGDTIITRNFIRYWENLISKLYKKVFEEEIGRDGFNLLNNIVVIGVGQVLFALFSFSISIIIGNKLGPSEFGIITLIQSYGIIITLPMNFGLNYSMERKISEVKTLNEKKTILTTIYIINILFIVTIAILLFSSEKYFRNKLEISRFVYHYSIIYAISIQLLNMLSSGLRGLFLTRSYSLSLIVNGFVSFLVMLIYLHEGTLNVYNAINCIILGIIVSIIVSLFILRKYFGKFVMDKILLSNILTYARFVFYSSFAFIIYTNIDKILINSYLSEYELGIYRAYTTSYLMIVFYGISLIISAFFPFASQYQNKKILFSRIIKLSPILILIGTPSLFGFGYILLSLFGKNFHFDLKLAIFFSLTGIIFLIYSLLHWFYNSVGVEGIKMVVHSSIIIMFTNILLNIIFIKRYQITGAIFSLLISQFIGLLYLYSKHKIILEKTTM